MRWVIYPLVAVSVVMNAVVWYGIFRTHRRQTRRTGRIGTADRLLLEYLTPAQRTQLRRHGFFDVEWDPSLVSQLLPRAGKIRIEMESDYRDPRVTMMRSGHTFRRYCIGRGYHVPAGVPAADIALAHVLMLRHDPEQWFATAVAY